MTRQINLTLGTAGHIDHGKTALVKMLTGCDTDRLKEEKERGMSIELGFAPCTVADTEVGIVDVPGHEHFIKTMVAGATGIDAAILVVAADDGIMPQTREHLDIMKLLGIQRGIVALTKTDRVDARRLEEMRGELVVFLQGTFLENAAILAVSNVTGEGFLEFHKALADLLSSLTPRSTEGVFRLPVERAFSIRGHGTVVTGIPVSGTVCAGDEVALLPQNLTGRIHSVQVYGRDSDAARAGQCAALNIRHLESQSVHRGDALVTPGFFSPESWFVATVHMLPDARAELKHAEHVRLHTGTSDVQATLYLLDCEHLLPGQTALVQLRADSPIIVGPADRFILRTLSPTRTVAGGMLLEAVPGRVRRTQPGLLNVLDELRRAVQSPSSFVEYSLCHAPTLATSPQDLAVHTKIPPARVQSILTELADKKDAVRLTPSLFMHTRTLTETRSRIEQMIESFHAASPQSPGMTRAELEAATHVEKAVLSPILDLMLADRTLVSTGERLGLARHHVTFSDTDSRNLQLIESLFRKDPFHPPCADDLVRSTRLPAREVERLLKLLVEHRRISRVGPDLLFHVDAMEEARRRLVEHITKQGRLESVDFKYLLDTTRKFALPLLDHFDQVGVTVRVGNTRFLKNR